MGSTGASRDMAGRGSARRTIVVLGAVVALVGAVACAEEPGARAPAGPAATDGVALAAFEDCDALLDTARAEGRAAAAAWSSLRSDGVEAATAAPPATAASGEVAPSSDPTAPGGWGGTNVQEAGVDEPDVVKTDGDRLLVRSATGLAAVSSDTDGLSLEGSLALPASTGARLLADGGRALVISGGGDGLDVGHGGPVEEPAPEAVPWVGTTLTVVDVTDPAALAVESRTQLDGTVVSARLVDGVARIVTTSSPAPVAEARSWGGPPLDDVIEGWTAEDWLPRFRTLDAAGRETDAGPLVPCDAVYHPTGTTAGPVGPVGPGVPATVTVTTVDLRAPVPAPDGGAAIMGAGEVVYASPSSLYVTSTDPTARQGASTAIHRFAIGGRGPAVYTGSGTVPGSVLDQFSLSEGPGGELRVATTQWATGPDRPSESFVTVLATGGGGLEQMGQVGGLGRTEQIRSVRFLGGVGYVVTFRQTDPLYVVDLRDPTAPAVAGELKVPGYSGYLHPLGDGRVLGVGQDATDDGRLLGLQVSVFDVSDPAAPTRTATLTVPDGRALAEADHHAFLWAPEHGLAVLPATGVTPDGGHASGALAIGVDGDALVERGWLTHPVDDPHGVGIERALVVDDRLLTVSLGGIETADLGTLADRGWLALG